MSALGFEPDVGAGFELDVGAGFELDVGAGFERDVGAGVKDTVYAQYLSKSEPRPTVARTPTGSDVDHVLRD